MNFSVSFSSRCFVPASWCSERGQENDATQSCSVHSNRGDCGHIYELRSRALETRVRQYAAEDQGLVCASANNARLPSSKREGLLAICRLGGSPPQQIIFAPVVRQHRGRFERGTRLLIAAELVE
jgi:hypothetical protein